MASIDYVAENEAKVIITRAIKLEVGSSEHKTAIEAADKAQEIVNKKRKAEHEIELAEFKAKEDLRIKEKQVELEAADRKTKNKIEIGKSLGVLGLFIVSLRLDMKGKMISFDAPQAIMRNVLNRLRF